MTIYRTFETPQDYGLCLISVDSRQLNSSAQIRPFRGAIQVQIRAHYPGCSYH
jgi:hypothetical protein